MIDDYTAKKIVLERNAMNKVQKYCDEKNLPYPPELVTYLYDVMRFRNGD